MLRTRMKYISFKPVEGMDLYTSGKNSEENKEKVKNKSSEDLFLQKIMDQNWNAVESFAIEAFNSKRVCHALLDSLFWNRNYNNKERNLFSIKTFSQVFIEKDEWNGCCSVFGKNLLSDEDFCITLVKHKKWNGNCESFPENITSSESFIENLVKSDNWNGCAKHLGKTFKSCEMIIDSGKWDGEVSDLSLSTTSFQIVKKAITSHSWNGNCNFECNEVSENYDFLLKIIRGDLWNGKNGSIFEKYLEDIVFCQEVTLSKKWDGNPSWLLAGLENEEFCVSLMNSQKWNGELKCFAHTSWFPEKINDSEFIMSLLEDNSRWNGDLSFISKDVKASKSFVTKLISSSKWNGVYEEFFPKTLVDDYDFCIKIITHSNWCGKLPFLGENTSKSVKLLEYFLNNEKCIKHLSIYSLFDEEMVSLLQEKLNE